MDKNSLKKVQELAEAVKLHLEFESYVTAAELTERMVKAIFRSSKLWTNPKAIADDQYALFCGALSPQIEQVFSNLLYCSGINDDSPIHDGDTESPSDYGKPLRSDGFVYTEDDRPC